MRFVVFLLLLVYFKPLAQETSKPCNPNRVIQQPLQVAPYRITLHSGETKDITLAVTNVCQYDMDSIFISIANENFSFVNNVSFNDSFISHIPARQTDKSIRLTLNSSTTYFEKEDMIMLLLTYNDNEILYDELKVRLLPAKGFWGKIGLALFVFLVLLFIVIYYQLNKNN